MLFKAEVLGCYDHAADANKLLYAPLPGGLTFRESRRYTVEAAGDAGACEAFLKRVLSESTSHELHVGEPPVLGGYSFFLDYGMKPGALDLEKEMILTYFKSLENPPFQLNKLKIERRVYLFGAPASEIPGLSDRFVKDIVNPAVHHFSVTVA
jgi:hypothetical protein